MTTILGPTAVKFFESRKIDPETAKLPGVFTTADQWKKQAIVIDHKLRAEKTAEWRKWFAENIMN